MKKKEKSVCLLISDSKILGNNRKEQVSKKIGHTECHLDGFTCNAQIYQMGILGAFK